MLSTQGFRLSVLLTVLLFSGTVQAQTRLQQIADEAALAAAQVLSSGGQPVEAAAAAQQSLAANPGVVAQVGAASGNRSATVSVSAEKDKAAASSTARYLPPDQPANWAWASRQRFVVKPSPVVVGSSCTPDCEPNSLR